MDIRKFVSLCDSTLTSNENLQRILAFVGENYNIDEKKNERLKEKIRITISKYKSKWQEVSRIKERFNTRFQTWLDGDFGIEEFIVEDLNSSTSSASSSAMKRGRPSKPFSELSERGKRRIIDSQVVDPKEDSIEKALLLARRTAYHQKEQNMVKVIGHILKNQEISNRMLAQLTDQHGRMSAEEAFGVLIEAGLSKSQYEIIHRESPSRFPPYNVIGAVKKTCSPPGEFIEETGSKISVKMQALMENTAKRIIKIVDGEIIEYLDANGLDSTELVLLSSWGMDGSTGYSQYHQALPEGCKDDSDVFSSTLTPVRLFMHNNQKQIMWFNPMPQSIRFCRPIMLEFIKESKEVILATKKELEKEMCELTPVEVELSNGKTVLVDFDFVLSMIDGKVLTYITGNSSMSNCPICGATPNVMSSAKKFEEGFIPNEEALHYGISPLHAWIRFFECLLHISYRMDVKKWRISKPLRHMYAKEKKCVGRPLQKIGE
jgi:hypothetical protein